jgi:nitric oxide reductase large subunit
MLAMRRAWLALSIVLLVSFGVLAWVGSRIYQLAPPIPDRVVASDGRVVFGPGEVAAGQDVWRSLGGMELGSIWGHGSYVAPDWTADWLHRELTGILDEWTARERGAAYAEVAPEVQAALRERLKREVRASSYDDATRTITVSPHRARAIEANVAYYTALFADGRDDYALPRGAINPPVALYYMQGLNTTPVHGHTALFGVYGMLGLGLVLFAVKSLRPTLVWPERLLSFAFWSINLGLGAMVLLSVLPVGLLQTQAAVDTGYWYARSAELLHTPLMEKLRWLRAVGDTVFAAGAIAFVIAIARMTVGRRRSAAAAA